MAEIGLDDRLSELIPIILEWKAFRAFLQKIDAENKQSDYDLFVSWINASLARIEPYLHPGFWPPIWWRLAHVDFDWLVRSIRRVDSDGYFRSGDGFVPEREAIMAWVDRIDGMLQGRSG